MEPVALGVKTPDVLERLSSILSIRGQQQGLAGQAAEVKSAQQTQKQRAALAAFDFSKHTDESGLPDLNGLSTDPELRAAAGDQFLDVIGKVAGVREQQLQNMRTMTALRSDQVAALGKLANGLRGDSDVVADNDVGRQKVNQMLLQYGETHGPAAYPTLRAYSGQLTNVPKGKLGDALKVLGMQAQSVAEQTAGLQGQFVDTGATLQQIGPNASPGAPTSIEKTIPPGVIMVEDQTGAKYLLDQQKNRVTPVGAGRGGVSPSAPPGAPTFQQPTYPGQAEDIKHNQEEVRSVRLAADQAPLQANTFRNILKLSETTNTGPLVKFIQDTKIGGQTFGNDYQELAKYLEKNAITAMQAMGAPGSDSRLAAAVAANGSTGFNPQALRAVTQFNYAANTGLEMYRKGIDAAVGTTNPNYIKLPEFKAEWAKNFDIDALRLENAVKDGDKKTQSEILDSLNAAQKKELAGKLRNLEALSTTGKLP